MSDDRHLERIADLIHDNNQMLRDCLFELQEMKDTLQKRLPEPQKPTVVRKTWYHNPNDTKPPNCS